MNLGTINCAPTKNLTLCLPVGVRFIEPFIKEIENHEKGKSGHI